MKPRDKTRSRFGLIANIVKRTPFGSSSGSKVLLNSSGEPVNVDEVEATKGRYVGRLNDVLLRRYRSL